MYLQIWQDNENIKKLWLTCCRYLRPKAIWIVAAEARQILLTFPIVMSAVGPDRSAGTRIRRLVLFWVTMLVAGNALPAVV